MTDAEAAPGPTVSPCPSCGEPVVATDQFCESCGTALREPDAIVVVEEIPPGGSIMPVAAAPRRCSCGGEIDADGYCATCGLRARSERDHFTERPDPRVAFVCDKGIVHTRNEDAAAVSVSDQRIVLVVCDGVTSATDSDIASLAAARAARDVLAGAPDAPSPSPAVVVEHWTDQLVVATAAAQHEAAAAAAGVPPGHNPPSSTYVAAVVDGPLLAAAWVGDSRCYWLPDAGPALQVSTDDSWATVQIAGGTPREVAEADSRAHAITRWLGIDSPDGEPSSTSVALEGPGWVLVCSDGLWNYCSPAANLRELLVRQVAEVGDDPLAVASAMCQWANDQGGHDNVTVALAHLVGADASDAPGRDGPSETPVPEAGVPETGSETTGSLTPTSTRRA
ncbi:MAG: protein phosphatase 2C domain-containing protein [Acidimicrobiia bacterium]